MESQAGLAGEPAVDLLAGEPALVGGGVFEFVAVAGRLVRAEDGGEGRHLEVADAGELVVDLALLGRELDLVGERLPAASAAHAEMAAERLQALLGRLDDADDRALEPGFLLAYQADVHDVARDGESHEDDLAFGGVGDGLALRGHGFDREVLEDDV